MKRIFSIAIMLIAALNANATDFNKGWTFTCDNGAPKIVDLPHDAMIHGERKPDVPGGNSVGYHAGGMFVYEKTFDVPAEWLDKNVSFEFGGVYKEAKVYINGRLAGGYPYGYMPFTVIADDFIHEGSNTIKVVADNVGQRSSRWYSGGGIYRPVELVVKHPVHVKDAKVTTLSIKPEAEIRINVEHTGERAVTEVLDGDKVIASVSGNENVVRIPDARLWDAENPVLYSIRVTAYDSNGNACDVVTEKFGIRTITWDRYGFYVNGKEVELKGGCLHSDNGIVGSEEYREAADRKVKILKNFGFNAIRSAHNPCSEEMLEACDSLGMYVMDELWDMWFRSKNPNDYGKYFMDNYRNDLVAIVEKDYNHPSVIMYSIGNEISEPTAPGGLEITQDIVKRLHELDSSRPVTGGMNTIILGSGAGRGLMLSGQNENEEKPSTRNEEKKKRRRKKSDREYVEPEIPEGGLVSFADMFRSGNISSEEYNKLVQQHILTDDYMIMGRELDSIITPSLDELDIVGYNYATVRYPSEESRHPGRIVFGSETYPQDIWKNWEMVKEYPYVVGDFMWTAWDYIGECGIGAWSYGDRQRGYPYKLADCGALDLIGNPTGEAYWAQVTWEEKPGNPLIAVRPVSEVTPRVSQWRGTNSIPSWTWTGKEGVKATVEVFSSARRVKLYLNGKLIGKAKTENGVATFEVPYQAGKLVAKAYGFLFKKGESMLETSVGANTIALTPEVDKAQAGELVFVRVDVVGENGVVNSQYSQNLSITVDGGELKGFGSGEPVTEARFDKGTYPAYYGQALAAVKAGNSKDLTITVSGEGLESQTVRIPIN